MCVCLKWEQEPLDGLRTVNMAPVGLCSTVVFNPRRAYFTHLICNHVKQGLVGVRLNDPSRYAATSANPTAEKRNLEFWNLRVQKKNRNIEKILTYTVYLWLLLQICPSHLRQFFWTRAGAGNSGPCALTLLRPLSDSKISLYFLHPLFVFNRVKVCRASLEQHERVNYSIFCLGWTICLYGCFFLERCVNLVPRCKISSTKRDFISIGWLLCYTSDLC